MTRALLYSAVVVGAVTLAGCGRSAPPPASNARASSPSAAAAQQPPVGTPAGEGAAAAEKNGGLDSLFESLAVARGGRPIPDGLVAGGDCPPAGPGAAEEISAQAGARVPLTVGLTLADIWKPNAREEYECLTQITKVHDTGIDFTIGCNSPKTPGHLLRRVCRSDLRDATMLHTQVGTITVIDASGEDAPETIVGTTEFSLSAREFDELKRTGTTRHHYVQIGSEHTLAMEATAVLHLEGRQMASVVVNSSAVDLPVVRASGEADIWRSGASHKGWVTALILDDDRFPLLVDYAQSTAKDGPADFRLHFPKISFPQAGQGSGTGQAPAGNLAGGAPPGRSGSVSDMERQLAEEKRVDVYGIYFDFASDRIRKESEPILQELAGMLTRNPDWTLSIDGHTDSIGGDTFNLGLSQRRSEAVRRALVERYGIAPERLTTAGHGASAPKDTNDTPEGRAKNRRVELIRRE
jgi:outer membrane protein OmpA-like peptidoglycan-associated protein